jgi:transcriptional regulator NrdR family protein
VFYIRLGGGRFGKQLNEKEMEFIATDLHVTKRSTKTNQITEEKQEELVFEIRFLSNGDVREFKSIDIAASIMEKLKSIKPLT